MANHFEVIDADGHITETDAQLKKYMPEKYVKRVSTLTPGDSWDRSLSGKLGTRAGDAKSWLAAMDRGGVSTAVLYPTNDHLAWLYAANRDRLSTAFLMHSPSEHAVFTLLDKARLHDACTHPEVGIEVPARM